MQRSTFLLLALFGCGGPSVVGDAATEDATNTTDSQVAEGSVCTLPPSSGEPEVVRTDRAVLRGVREGNTIAFKGVRYVAAPTGMRRFRAPEAAPCESTVVEAREFGAQCPQWDTRMGQRVRIGQEDCLTLNVWTPAVSPGTPLPVLFFIHGGGNNQGSSSILAGTVPVYDGRRLAERGAVVVTINYRIGALGFLSHESLDRENSNNTSGNWGILDQLEALRWVQRNIAQFHGDPSRVMIFGESAGGVNVFTLLASPLSRGLFHRAIAQSGGASAVTRDVARASSQRLLTATNCASAAAPIDCLRGKTPEEILDALPVTVTGLTPNDFAVSVDNYVLTQPMNTTFMSGTYQRVPFIAGTNRDETAIFLAASMVRTEAEYLTAARTFLSQFLLPTAVIDRVLALYPVASFASPQAALVALTTDVRWTCPTRATLRTMLPHQSTSLYRYYFTQSLDAMRAPVVSQLGAYHGLELFYVFGSVDGAGGYRATAADLALSSAMQTAWVRFAATGNPNNEGSSSWSAYDTNDPYYEWGTPARADRGVRSAACDALIAAVAMP